MTALGYVVVHDYHLDDGRGHTRDDRNIASSVHAKIDTCENALGYCLDLQENGHPGSDGEYYIAALMPVLELKSAAVLAAQS